MGKERWSPDKIKTLREKYKLSQRNLGILLGTTQQHIYQWEKGLKRVGRLLSQELDIVEARLEIVMRECDGDRKRFQKLVGFLGISNSRKEMKNV